MRRARSRYVHDPGARARVARSLGQVVATLVNEEKEAGLNHVEFDGTGLASGVYLYRLRAGEYVETRKLVLLK